MGFYEQYEKICESRGVPPCSKKAADLFGVTKSTISQWKIRNKAPIGDTVKVIADYFGVSTDYLLGRTDDPTNYSNPDLLAEMAGSVLDGFDGAALRESANLLSKKSRIEDLYDQLDATDRIRVEAYIEGILTGDKYRNRKKAEYQDA